MACEIWHELCTQFNQTNFAHIFNSDKEICTISHGNDGTAPYFTRNKTLWDELLSLQAFPICHCGLGLVAKKYEQEQRLVGFLVRLNEAYTSVRGTVLMMTPTPSLEQLTPC